MITVRAGSAALGVCLLLVLGGCSREQQDWRSAESADTIESYGQFLQRHPESELATQARARVAQLGEDRDWQHAGSADTVDAYREFLTQHPNGKWAQEAHIRIENFSLGEQAGTDAGSKAVSAAVGSGGAVTTPGSGAPSGGAVPVGSARSVAPATNRVSPPSGSAAARAPSAAAPSSKPAATAAAFPPKGGFGIQLGAFTTEAGATAQWQALTSRYASELQGLQQHVVPATTASGRIYRLQAAVGDEGRARSICDHLKARGQACVAVLPH